MTRIVLDAMGSDEHPVPDVEGAVAAARELAVEVILVGDKARIDPLLLGARARDLPIRVVHASEVLSMEDKGEALTLKARHKDAQNSMAVGIDLVKRGDADAFVTAGNTGAAMVTALFRLGRIRGVDRPALAVIFPTASGTCVVLDVGANPDCKPENLLQFAIMGGLYATRVRGVPSPRVGLISNAEEEGKGNELVKAATPLLRASGINFVGNVEGKEVIGGKVDVAVCDGFVGNVLLKTSEAIAKLITDKIRESIRSGGPLAMAGGALVRTSLGKVRTMLDPTEEGAAPMLGVNGLVLIGHGRSNAYAIKNAIRVAANAATSGLLSEMRAALEGSQAKLVA